MEGMPNVLKTTLMLVMNGLKTDPAPTPIGYNDMALMIAYGLSDVTAPPSVSASKISGFLARHVAVPENGRMSPEQTQGYLDVLEERQLLDQLGKVPERTYRMRRDTSEVLIAGTERIKSPHIDDLLFHGFRLYATREQRQSLTERDFRLDLFD